MTILYQTKMCSSDRDEIDRIPSRDRATNWDVAGFVFSIFSHIADVFFDCNVAYRYYASKHLSYFFATLSFIIIPAIINTAFSVRMYVLDHENVNRGSNLTKKFTRKRLCIIFILIFQLAPILRYFDALKYALKSQKAEKNKDVENQRKYYEMMAKEDSDVALLRVLECFLEAAPQLILQLAIIFHSKGKEMEGDTFTIIHQLLSIGSSFVSMAWSMASYQRLLRVSLRTKNNISWSGTIVQFMWHFLVTVSRILCISVIASIYPTETIVVIIGHWFVMTLWLACTSAKNNFCDHNSLYDFLFYCILGAVYIFTHVVLVEGRTFLKYVIFYCVLFAENTIANVVWIISADEAVREKVYYLPIILLNVIPFFLGIVFMVLYYKVFHPSLSTGYNRQQAAAAVAATT
ncbi:XK-related protein 6-like isoform X1 [Diorhabda sublineata]|uniref:XK-related protein 6-like isoform X1 n=1 Tax=Diorhabda sublineata TaxID=1163346 RepID=UPI0024E05CED|nr:XK-related protein 6-like isoform X1 [Diorhabda sublineata]